MLDACGTPPRRVGVFAYRSETAYVGVPAARLRRVTFVPLNRTFPLRRTRRMIELAELDALIVDRGSLPQLAEILDGLERAPACLVLADDEPGDEPDLGVAVRGRFDLQRAEALQTLPVATPDDVAYLLFTSGSTGQPRACR